MISLDYLKSILDYNPETGEFRWKVSRGSVSIGRKAGRKKTIGYIEIRIDNVLYQAHILAWYYITGEWPLSDIDHKNRIRNDNRFKNLRLASRSQNIANQTKNKNNTSGYKGVTWHKGRKKWQVQIMKDGKYYYLGAFSSLEEAYNHHRKKVLEFCGEFACW